MAKIIEITKLDANTTSSRTDLGHLTVDQPLSERYKYYEKLLSEKPKAST